MPIQIDRTKAEHLAPQFDEALELVRNEFDGLDPHRQYHNAFARLLKSDPLGRVMMMGTDQRDMFVPELRRAIEMSVPSDGHILDFGAGDGQTSPWSPIQCRTVPAFRSRNPIPNTSQTIVRI